MYLNSNNLLVPESMAANKKKKIRTCASCNHPLSHGRIHLKHPFIPHPSHLRIPSNRDQHTRILAHTRTQMQLLCHALATTLAPLCRHASSGFSSRSPEYLRYTLVNLELDKSSSSINSSLLCLECIVDI